MDEEAARGWAGARVPRGTIDALDRLAALVIDENNRQNLVARSTLDQLWARHVVDSLQLLDLAPAGAWLDIGSGAGFPGLVVAVASGRAVTLAEPRARRAAFLAHAAAVLGIGDRVRVHAGRVETLVAPTFAVVSARAVAALPGLFAMAHHLVAPTTCWLLPKGRRAADELAEARRTWQGQYRLVASVTDAAAAIIVATDVRPGTR